MISDLEHVIEKVGNLILYPSPGLMFESQIISINFCLFGKLEDSFCVADVVIPVGNGLQREFSGLFMQIWGRLLLVVVIQSGQ